jgi:hypothetical protein
MENKRPKERNTIKKNDRVKSERTNFALESEKMSNKQNKEKRMKEKSDQRITRKNASTKEQVSNNPKNSLEDEKLN